ncbi:MAG: ParB N-terminal domain-containing protein [Desulfatitalea sp.]|nr:ParB N-terminal domain-containing protein [Desulfatitalea sp.]MBI5895100.1 ParB N-terminal domain-containing protein [Desulfobacterales bacterium]
MDCDYRGVPLARIDEEDQRFRITTRTSVDAIRASIQKIGLINAPTLIPHNDGFVVVAGFGRIAACRSLGWDQLTARCLPAQTEPVLCALTAISDNLSQRVLNLVEMARAWVLLSRVVDRPQAVGPLAHSVGLAVNNELASKLKIVLQMEQPLQQALIDGDLALPIALRLQSMADDAAAKELVALFQELQLSLNRQREVLEWIQGIAGREGVQPQEVITAEPIAQWRHDPQMDRGQKTQLIRHYLKKRRYPEITAYEERYQQAVKELKLAEGMQLVAPQHFEGQKYTLHLEFKNKDELQRLCREAERVAGSPTMLKLLNPTN